MQDTDATETKRAQPLPLGISSDSKIRSPVQIESEFVKVEKWQINVPRFLDNLCSSFH